MQYAHHVPISHHLQSVTSRNFAVSLLVEFLGVMLFTFIGSTVTNPTLGPFVNGFSLAVWIYTAANISGGHLNPAVTFSTLICGFYPLLHSLLYIALQVMMCLGFIGLQWPVPCRIHGAIYCLTGQA
jgi:glycerol uptake facilitator-like aquaporin